MNSHNIKIALIVDDLTSTILESEATVRHLTPLNYKFILKFFKPDFVFTESAWIGKKNAWKNRIASYPDMPNRNNKKLIQVINYAKKLGIPTIFWDKEGIDHFDRFLDSANLFDRVYSVDNLWIEKFNLLNLNKKASLLPFFVSAKVHSPDNIKKIDKFCFFGSHRRDIHKERKNIQQMMFETALPFGLEIYDRNSNRKSKIFRFPDEYTKYVKPSIKYSEIGKYFSQYIGCLNVNTNSKSPTMCSRRVIDALALQVPLISYHTPAMEQFRDFVFTFKTKEELHNILNKLKYETSKTDLEKKLKNGREYVFKNFNIQNFLNNL